MASSGITSVGMLGHPRTPPTTDPSTISPSATAYCLPAMKPRAVDRVEDPKRALSSRRPRAAVDRVRDERLGAGGTPSSRRGASSMNPAAPTQRLVHETRDSTACGALRRAPGVGGFLGDQLYFRMGPPSQRLTRACAARRPRRSRASRRASPRGRPARGCPALSDAQPARELHVCPRPRLRARLAGNDAGRALERLLGRSGRARRRGARARRAARATP